MKYRVIKLYEEDLEKFDGKIVQVIESHKEDTMVGRDQFGYQINRYGWALTCLVEVGE